MLIQDPMAIQDARVHTRYYDVDYKQIVQKFGRGRFF